MPKMRTMPSDTLVTVPSLRASAARPTFSMRVLISSLISDGLSVVVAIAFFLWRESLSAAARFKSVRDSGLGTRDSSLRQRGLQALELAFQGTVDDDVAGVDHGAADQALVDRGVDLDLAAEARAQRGLDRLELGRG